jgi:hypothetical protein
MSAACRPRWSSPVPCRRQYRPAAVPASFNPSLVIATRCPAGLQGLHEAKLLLQGYPGRPRCPSGTACWCGARCRLSCSRSFGPVTAPRPGRGGQRRRPARQRHEVAGRKVFGERDARLLAALTELYETGSAERIDVAVVYGAKHAPSSRIRSPIRSATDHHLRCGSPRWSGDGPSYCRVFRPCREHRCRQRCPARD